LLVFEEHMPDPSSWLILRFPCWTPVRIQFYIYYTYMTIKGKIVTIYVIRLHESDSQHLLHLIEFSVRLKQKRIDKLTYSVLILLA
jgi:hypothetical protein